MYFNTVIIIIFMYMYSMYIMYAYIFHNDNNVIIKLSNNNNYRCKKLKTTKKNYIYNKHITKDLHYYINRIYKYLKISMYKSLCIYILCIICT